MTFLQVAELTEGLTCRLAPEHGSFDVDPTTTSMILQDWYRQLGTEKYLRLVEQLLNGKEVQSPIIPHFTYQAGSPAGQQEQLF